MKSECGLDMSAPPQHLPPAFLNMILIGRVTKAPRLSLLFVVVCHCECMAPIETGLC